MKYINVFETETAFNNASSNLSRPQLSFTADSGKIFCMTENVTPKPTINLIDLGLSVKWSDRNIGATCETTANSWYGDYIAWAETSAKKSYQWDTYIYYADAGLTKYNDTDGKTILETSDDAAAVYNHRIPTVAEWNELFDETKISHNMVSSYKGISGLDGMLFTSKITGYTDASIFIPTIGYKTGELPYVFGTYYWSANVDTTNRNKANNLYIDILDEMSIDSQDRYIGLPVRGVQ